MTRSRNGMASKSRRSPCWPERTRRLLALGNPQRLVALQHAPQAPRDEGEPDVGATGLQILDRVAGVVG